MNIREVVPPLEVQAQLLRAGFLSVRRTRFARSGWLAGFLACLSFLCLVVLRFLPYSTSWIERVPDREAGAAPGESFSSVGPLSWDLLLFRSAPQLQPFRDAFGPRCSGMLGIEAARCVSDIIKAKSARGEPRTEFVDATFDPAADLGEHMAGAPGHCTARSSMTATSLLALGIPARIVQVLPTDDRGHNLVEVWDPRGGWALFDPHFESSYLLGDSFVSAVQLSRIQGGLRWRRPSEGQPDPNVFAGSTIHYPEPWLYTRVGARCATWPFRGCFAQVGPARFRFGPAQRLALGAVVLSAVAAAIWALRMLILWRRAARR